MGRYGYLLVGGGGLVIGALLGGQREVLEVIAKLSVNPDIELAKTALNIGGVVFIAALMMLFLYRLASQYGGTFVGAVAKVSESMACQAGCVSELKDCVKEMTKHGNDDHREILLSMQVMADNFKRMAEDMRLHHEKDDHESA